MDKYNFVKTKQRLAIIKALRDNLSKGQMWVAFYDNQYRVALGLVKLGIIEHVGLSDVFCLPGKCQPEPPDYLGRGEE